MAPRAQGGRLRRVAEHGFFGLACPLADLTADLLMRDETYALMDRVRAEMARYIRVAVNVLGGHALNWREDMPFLWLDLPAGWRAAALCQ